MNLKDGLYAIDVSLWHETENKPSMGNGALDHKAELFVKDGVATLFLGTKALSVSNIQASLCRVFYETDEGFSAAVPLCYDLKVEGEELPRPRIFALPLKEKNRHDEGEGRSEGGAYGGRAFKCPIEIRF